MSATRCPRAAALLFAPLVMLTGPALADDLALRVGFTLPYATQPGARVNGLYAVALDPPETTGWRSTLSFGPQVAVYTWPARNTHVQFGGLAGYGLHSPGGWFEHQLSLGLAYVAEAYIDTVTVDLGSGEVTDDYGLRNHALPTAHYTFAVNFTDAWSWYLDIGAGLLLSPDVDAALYLAADTGVQVRFGAPAAPGEDPR